MATIFDFIAPQGINPNAQTYGSPKTLSGRVQEWLGAKEPDQGGQVQDILSQRFQPDTGDISRGLIETARTGSFTPAQTFADERLDSHIKRLSDIQKMQGGGGASPAAIQIANEIQKRRAAGDNEGADLLAATAKIYDKGTYFDPETGNQVTIPGYGQALGGIEYFKKRGGQQGQKDVDLQMNPLIAGAEADAKNISDVTYAAEQERQKKIGAGEITDIEKKQGAQSQLSQIIGSMRRDYSKLDALGGITSTRRSPEENAAISAKTSKLGQGIGRITASGEQVLRENINSSIPLLMSAIKSATGKSASEINSIPEMQLLKASVTDPTMPIETVLNQLEQLERLYASPNVNGVNPGMALPGSNFGGLPPDKKARLEELRAKRDAGTLR